MPTPRSRLPSRLLLGLVCTVPLAAQGGIVFPNPGDVVVRFDLVGVTYAAGSLGGYFLYDFTQQGWSYVEIHYLPGSAVSYGNPFSDPMHITPTLITGSHNSQTTSYDFELPLAHALTPTTGSAVAVDPPGTPTSQLNAWISVDNGTTAPIFAITGGSLVPVVPTWLDLGHALVGSNGTPQLTGTGALTANSSNHVDLTQAAPNTTTLLVVGFTQIDQPLLGGTLVPDLALEAVLATDATGSASLPFVWPAFLPPGLAVYLQYWTIDPAAANGVSASNGLRGFSH